MTTTATNLASTGTQVASSAVVERAKSRPAFYTRNDAVIAMALWLGTVMTDRAPKFIGTIGGVQVSGFVRSGEKGAFIDFVGAKMADGKSTPVAKGNLVVNGAGIPKLVVRMEGSNDPIWIEVSLGLSHDDQVACGLNVEIQSTKKAAHAAKKAAPAEAVAA